MNGEMWAALCEWDGINIEVKVLVNSGLFVANWETF